MTLAGAANAAVTVNSVAEDMVRNIENVQGGSGNDTLVGDGLANSLVGAATATIRWSAASAGKTSQAVPAPK